MRTFALSIQNTQSAQSNGVQRGIALKAAMVAAAQSSLAPLPNTTILFDTLMNLSVLRNQNPQYARPAPPPRPLGQTAEPQQGESSDIEFDGNGPEPFDVSAIANLVAKSTQPDMHRNPIEDPDAGPASQNIVLAHDQHNAASDDDGSSSDTDPSTILSKAMRTRSAELTSESQRQRVTSPPQARTSKSQKEAQQISNDSNFYGAPKVASTKRARHQAPAPEKRLRRERKTSKPPRKGLN